jgi:uncharacterized protein with PIN domain
MVLGKQQIRKIKVLMMVRLMRLGRNLGFCTLTYSNKEADHLEEVMMQEQEILNRKSQALKQYITDNILPVLTSGLIEICNEKPENPLDYLVKFHVRSLTSRPTI